MSKKLFLGFLLLMFFQVSGQNVRKDVLRKTLEVRNDTVFIDSISISPYHLKVYDLNEEEYAASDYTPDYAAGFLVFKGTHPEKVIVEYRPLPVFMTKTYRYLEDSVIAEKTQDLTRMYSVQNPNKPKIDKLFGDLYTSGNLSRAVTVGNNQDEVVNSNFNLQIQGKLAKDVGIRASITDNNIPLQEGGYTQRLNEFDRVFIELYGKGWKINAGDVYLQNTGGTYLKFNKKISGVYVESEFPVSEAKGKAFASGAMVRGKFSTFRFNGVEGNQGPYRIRGLNNEQLFLIVSGSETVYMNGTPLRRGENYDYTIDYNTGEISFTSLFQVNSNMRFVVDYQLVETNYARFITYDGVDFRSDKLKFGVKYYNEADLKNSPKGQELTDEHKQILADAGNDKLKMVAESAVVREYSKNRILYRKRTLGSDTIYEYSNDPDEVLYEVKFSFVGANRGNYIVKTTLAPGRVYQFVQPVNGVPQGSYEPVILLAAPEKKQIVDLDLEYNYGKSGVVTSEIAFSNNDRNLFSSIDNEMNRGFAGKLNWQHHITGREWKLDANAKYEFISPDFQTVERYRNVEFSRDWNLELENILKPAGQSFLTAGLALKNDRKGYVNYQFENLVFNEDFKGFRHLLFSDLNFGQTTLRVRSSLLNSDSERYKNDFLRWHALVKHRFGKAWAGGKFDLENNKRTDKQTGSFSDRSFKLAEMEVFGGVGDSAKVFVAAGYNFQKVDSVYNTSLQKVNDAHTLYLHSRLIKSKNSDLSINGSYRRLNRVFGEGEESINGRMMYRQLFFRNLVQYNLTYETQSGTLPQQDFTYIEVKPGKGFYAWIDFNGNGIQELDEFVVARFQDEAKYVRVLLPGIRYIRTHRNKFSQSLQVNFHRWQNASGFKKLASHFSNQTYFLIDANEKRDGSSINFNPFRIDENKLLALDRQVRNSLFFNRGLQHFSTGYIYQDTRRKSYLNTDDLDNRIKSHQIQFSHKLNLFWLLEMNMLQNNIISKSARFTNRNYDLDNRIFNPKISFLKSRDFRVTGAYTFKDKRNTMDAMERLKMHVIGAKVQYANKQFLSLNAGFDWIRNEFSGQTQSPVAYQMLEGLQPGQNFTWVFGFQKRIFKFLDLNISYYGRKSEESNAIHTGTVQLRANF